MQTWYRIRSLLTRTNSPVGILFLVTAATYRCQKYQLTIADLNPFSDISTNIDDSAYTYKLRICNMLKNVTAQNSSPARKNPLLWRIYLRSLLDVHGNFEKSRNALFAALDECPWNKVNFFRLTYLNVFKTILFFCRQFIWTAVFMCHKSCRTFKT